MDEPTIQPFLDVPVLLESSLPRRRGQWHWQVGMLLLLFLVAMSFLGSQLQSGSGLAEKLSAFGAVCLMVGAWAMSRMTLRTVRREQEASDAAEELIQLRRWNEAAAVLQQVLSMPARTPQSRLRNLIYLATVLGRYHRFSDAVAVHEHLLDAYELDAPTERAVLLGRAFALLQEDRLFDADRAIADLRRTPGASESGGLALVEIYRDVKTGHPQEALDLFLQKRDLIHRQLAHRSADAHALVARAYDLLGRSAEAAAEYQNATLLAPEGELHRRFSEVAVLAGKYPPAAIPREVA